MIQNDQRQQNMNFWLFWVIANAVGLSAGWVSGEVFGHYIAPIIGRRAGQIIAVLVFEGMLWLMRSVVLFHFPKHKAIRPLEIIIWVSTEWIGWVIGEAPTQPDSLLQFTSGAVLATVLGVSTWMIFGSIKMPKPGTKLWQIEAAIRISMAFISSVVLITISMVISLEMGETIARYSNLIVGMIITGMLMGAFVGAVTGLVFINLSSRRIPFPKNAL